MLSLLMVPVCYFPAVNVGKTLREFTKQENQENVEIHSIVEESLGVDGVLLMKIFGRQDAIYDKFKYVTLSFFSSLSPYKYYLRSQEA